MLVYESDPTEMVSDSTQRHLLVPALDEKTCYGVSHVPLPWPLSSRPAAALATHALLAVTLRLTQSVVSRPLMALSGVVTFTPPT